MKWQCCFMAHLRDLCITNPEILRGARRFCATGILPVLGHGQHGHGTALDAALPRCDSVVKSLLPFIQQGLVPKTPRGSRSYLSAYEVKPTEPIGPICPGPGGAKLSRGQPPRNWGPGFPFPQVKPAATYGSPHSVARPEAA